jgi:hypothetical protein
MKKSHIASFALASALSGGAATGTLAQQTGQQGGAAGVVAAVVQAVDTVDVNNNQIDVAVVELNNSLNNLRALNNVLNNSPILSNNDIDVTVQDISILDEAQIEVLTDFLNNNNIALDDVVGVSVLSGGDLIVFTS